MSADEKTWKEFTREIVVDYCNKKGSRTFTLKQFRHDNEEKIISFSESNKHPFDKIRQQLQFLEKEGIISFVDNRGTYTLRKPEILEGESAGGEEVASVYKAEPSKREYIRETFARDRGWVKEAKDKFGCYCLHPDCKNTFVKKDGLPYIEVHHIIPLFEGGEDAVWNLAVVCAHHHKMAHFADDDTQKNLRNVFLKTIEKFL